jgi:uncharacterized membrane protein YedE/YeeE
LKIYYANYALKFLLLLHKYTILFKIAYYYIKGIDMGKRYWNPYIAGAICGIILILSVIISGKYFGASTSFPRMASVVEQWIGIDPSQFEYYTVKDGKYGPTSLPNWQLLFLVGIFIGALVPTLLSKSFKMSYVPSMWISRFGNSRWKRGLVAFIGGFIAIIGVRLAGGCPSGHGLSGLAQLSISGFLAMIFFFVGGVVVARFLYGGRQ